PEARGEEPGSAVGQIPNVRRALIRFSSSRTQPRHPGRFLSHVSLHGPMHQFRFEFTVFLLIPEVVELMWIELQVKELTFIRMHVPSDFITSFYISFLVEFGPLESVFGYHPIAYLIGFAIP